MKMKLEFFMAMKNVPTVTAQEHKIVIRNGKPFYYDPSELLAARQKLTDHLAAFRPASWIGGPIELTTTWCFHTEDSRLDGTFKITKPDTDNLNKLLKDCMTQLGFWNDDAQVCREIIEKYWVKTSPSGIWVRIRQL